MGIKTEKHILSESDFLWVCDTLCKQLYYGVSIINGISHMSKTSPSRICPILNQIKHNLLQGQSFATAFFIHIPHSAPYRLTTTKIDNPITAAIPKPYGHTDASAIFLLNKNNICVLSKCKINY